MISSKNKGMTDQEIRKLARDTYATFPDAAHKSDIILIMEQLIINVLKRDNETDKPKLEQ